MRAADLPFGTIIADGPRVLVKLSAQLGPPWVEAMKPDVARNPMTDDEVNWHLRNGYEVVRYGLGEETR